MCESGRKVVDFDTLERYARLGRFISSYSSTSTAKHQIVLWPLLAGAMAVSAIALAAGALLGAALMKFIGS